MRRMASEQKGGLSYPDVDQLLYKMLRDRAPDGLSAAIADSVVGVIGSTIPWYESLVLAYGAAGTYTIEYNQVFYAHPNMTTVTAAEYEAMGAGRPRFPVVLSISSIEHDGLGRYGDPLNPEGDFQALGALEEVVAPGGLLVLAIPVSADRLVWNCHRIYGRSHSCSLRLSASLSSLSHARVVCRSRLTQLLERWTVLQTAGLAKGLLDEVVVSAPQPIFLLRNQRPPSPTSFLNDADPVWEKEIGK
eukprot:3618985-Rhodomonas_salina.1